jgi:hypothetical protein
MKSSSALMTASFQVGDQRRRKRGRTFCSMDATMVVIIRSGRGSALLVLTRFEPCYTSGAPCQCGNTDTALTNVA